MKNVMDMSASEYAKARAAMVNARPQSKPAPPPADTRPVSEMTYQEWEYARGVKPKPKLATEMTEAEYQVARAAMTRR